LRRTKSAEIKHVHVLKLMFFWKMALELYLFLLNGSERVCVWVLEGVFIVYVDIMGYIKLPNEMRGLYIPHYICKSGKSPQIKS
jgi:hypothetical protein